jgi:hypothetical protein
MAYCIFLKSLRILEEYRKTSCVKIPPKSSCANFQSLGKFKNLIFIQKGFFLASGPTGPAASQPIQPFWPTQLRRPPSSYFAKAGRVSPPSRTPPRQGRPPPAPWSGPDWSSPSLPPFTQLHFLPLLHSSNDSIEDAIHRRRPAYPGHLRLPPTPIKGDENPRPSPPIFPSLSSSLMPSFTLVSSSSHCHSSPPSRRLSTAAGATVRPELGSLCSPLSVAPPPASACASEWP